MVLLLPKPQPHPPAWQPLPTARKQNSTSSTSQIPSSKKSPVPPTTTMLPLPRLTLLATLVLLAAVLLAAPLTPRDRDAKFPMLDFWGYCLPCYKLCPAHNRGCTFSACIVKGKFVTEICYEKPIRIWPGDHPLEVPPPPPITMIPGEPAGL